jgi:hypothetical protein
MHLLWTPDSRPIRVCAFPWKTKFAPGGGREGTNQRRLQNRVTQTAPTVSKYALNFLPRKWKFQKSKQSLGGAIAPRCQSDQQGDHRDTREKKSERAGLGH